ncbi:hypothetical protein P691DRAFT_810305 [Macrolepiota fuliginosa MF-IS2]|uniref:DUF4139 domain-containing protein n=1 Tax=Macrolepiota fuliginosa MF-IS2 TaxID=1400762 RepID=A0A9P5XFK7_9AGAR|nr:hypothetical protein P691DRAFT_810305 [Macrolepiota fuliginosa MF-IS2]
MSSINTIRIVAAEYPVKSVVVLKSSKAEVVRTFVIALKGGQNKLVISKLPSTIETQSVRISGLNPNAPKNRTYLSDVVCSVAAVDDAPNEAVHMLEVKKSTLVHEKKVLDTQADVLVKYANSLTGEHANPDVMNVFLTSFVEHGRSNIRAIAKLEAEIAGIDKQIKEEKKKGSLLKGSIDTEVTVVITADNDTRIDLKLTYIVSNTHWSPTYELDAVTGENGQPSRTVSLHYRACITQSTGEDWSNAALTLSTVATDTIVKRIPRLEPVRIRVSYNGESRRAGLFGAQQQVQQQQQRAPNAFGAPAFGAPAPAFGFGAPVPAGRFGASAFGNTTSAPPAGLFGAASSQPSQPPPPTTHSAFGIFGAVSSQPPQPPPPAVPAATLTGSGEATPDDDLIFLDNEDSGSEKGGDADELPAKLVTQTPMALTYTVRGRSSIPSDGKEHIVTIAILPFETEIEYVSVPRVDPRVYLQCQVKNDSDYRLLPGPVSIILDDSYVSKTTIPDVNRNDVFNFTLGDDPSVIISYSRVLKSVKEGSGAFADVANVTTYTTWITVQNKHDFPIERLTLRDAIPISDDSRVRVVLRKPKELVEAKGVFVKVNRATGDSGEPDEDGLMVRWAKEKEGLYEYKWRVDGDDKISLGTVFEVKASSDLTCSFSEFTNGFGKKA